MVYKQGYTLTTLGSHTALQILKGAKDEGFNTAIVTTPDRESFYRRFRFIESILTINDFSKFSQVEKKLKALRAIIIPHGSFVAYLGINGNKNIHLPYFGNKKVLDWEADRNLQNKWLKHAGIKTPNEFTKVDKNINYPVIVKTHGAAGGRGYYFARNKTDLEKRLMYFKPGEFIIQEYIVGVNLYIHYFYSPITQQIEIVSIDRRYETNADGLGKIPASHQEGLGINPSYVVVGNSPLTLRESLLPEAYTMGEQVVKASRQLIDERGLFGPFCLETVITPQQEIYTIEISCRIVAGTNLFINGSPYSWLHYDEPMSTGRRIAREIKSALEQDQVDLLLD